MSLSTSSSTLPSTCPFCGSPLHVTTNDEGDLVCANCGFVLTPLIGYAVDEGSFGAKYDVRESFAKQREGLIHTRERVITAMHDGGIGTVIDTHGFKSSNRMKKTIRKISKLNERSKFRDSIDSLEGDLHKAANRLKDEISTLFELPSYISREIDEMVKYVVVKNKDKLKGMSRKRREALGYAIVLSVLEAYGIGLEGKILLKKLSLDQKMVRDVIAWKSKVTYQLGKEKILKIRASQDTLTRYLNYANFLISELNYELGLGLNGILKSRLSQTLKLMIKAALKLNLNSGKQKTSFLAGLIYLILHAFASDPKMKPTQEKVANALKLGNNSVRENYVKAVEELMILVYVPTKSHKSSKK